MLHHPFPKDLEMCPALDHIQFCPGEMHLFRQGKLGVSGTVRVYGSSLRGSRYPHYSAANNTKGQSGKPTSPPTLFPRGLTARGSGVSREAGTSSDHTGAKDFSNASFAAHAAPTSRQPSCFNGVNLTPFVLRIDRSSLGGVNIRTTSQSTTQRAGAKNPALTPVSS